jgi:hypothetical protein
VAGQPSELVEFTRGGVFGAEHSVDPNLGGAFGLAFGSVDGKLTFAAVYDNTSSLDVWRLTNRNKGKAETDILQLFRPPGFSNPGGLFLGPLTGFYDRTLRR